MQLQSFQQSHNPNNVNKFVYILVFMAQLCFLILGAENLDKYACCNLVLVITLCTSVTLSLTCIVLTTQYFSSQLQLLLGTVSD